MDITGFFNTDTFNLLILPLLIFTARVCDVTIGTVRIIFVSRGMKFLAPAFGFFEILIWLVAISKVMQNFTNVGYYIAYAGGFATGNYIGIIVEEKLAMGVCILRIVVRKDPSKLIEFLRAAGYGVTTINAEGASGPVEIIFTIIRRQDLKDTHDIIKRFNPKAFYSIEDVRFVSEGIFPLTRPWYRKNYLHSFRLHRKGK